MIEIRVLQGGEAGTRRAFEGPRVTVGRDPGADLRLHPDQDLAASAHHAALARLGPGQGWFVRDLGSRNGTYVNGRRVEGDSPLAHGDRIQFGVGGPVVEVILEPESHPSPSPSPAGEGQADTGQRVRIGVARETRRIRAFWATAALGLAVLLLITESGRRAERDRWEGERATLLSRVDSALSSGRDGALATRGRLADLEAALQASRAEVERLRGQISAMEQAPAASEMEALRSELVSATQALRRQQLAANLDFVAIETANRRAVTRVFVETAEGQLVRASGFAVRPEGVIVTSKHVFGGDRPSLPRQVGVQFTDSRQVFPARVLGASESRDLAVLQLERLTGTVPVVAGLNDATDSVDVVAMIGFPAGSGQALRDGEPEPVDPIISAGVVLTRGPDGIEIQGYGARGASGSPVFDGGGRVVGVVYGGRPDGPTRTVLAVPAQELSRLLDRVLR